MSFGSDSIWRLFDPVGFKGRRLQFQIREWRMWKHHCLTWEQLTEGWSESDRERGAEHWRKLEMGAPSPDKGHPYP